MMFQIRCAVCLLFFPYYLMCYLIPGVLNVRSSVSFLIKSSAIKRCRLIQRSHLICLKRTCRALIAMEGDILRKPIPSQKFYQLHYLQQEWAFLI